jgi:hypothetical protein
MAYFEHITNFVARQHGLITKGRKFLEPSVWLNVEMDNEQRYLLMPTAAEILVGSILDDSVGNNARRKIAKRRIDMISGNIASYSRSLNNPDSLADISDSNELASCLAEISAARDIAKDAAKEKKEANEKEKELKKASNQLALETKKEQLHDELFAEVDKGIEHIRSVTKKKTLQDLLKYYFDVKVKNMAKKSREELITLVENAWDRPQQEATEGIIPDAAREQEQV